MVHPEAARGPLEPQFPANHANISLSSGGRCLWAPSCQLKLIGGETMKTIITTTGKALVCMFLVAALAGCGGTKILKEPEPLVLEGPLVANSDDRLAVDLDWIIVRDSPGTWARNADWDEYLIQIRNTSGDPVQVTSIRVFDSGEVGHESVPNRKKLVKGSRKTARRYRGEGLEVKAGLGGGALVVAGGVAASVGMSAGAAAVYGSTATAAGAAGALLLAPVFITGGVIKGVNNSKVNSEIENRQTLLPMEVGPNESRPVNLFFPIAPSPSRVEVNYVDSIGEHLLVLDTSEALAGLHLVAQ